MADEEPKETIYFRLVKMIFEIAAQNYAPLHRFSGERGVYEGALMGRDVLVDIS